jgi:hypothetical protein
MITLLGHNWKRGDELFVRAQLIEACSDAFQISIEDYPRFAATVWVPVREVARREDIDLLLYPRRGDLKFRDRAVNPDYLRER